VRSTGTRHERADYAAIDQSEDTAAIGGALLLRASRADTGPAVTALLDAIVALLTGGERRQ